MLTRILLIYFLLFSSKIVFSQLTFGAIIDTNAEARKIKVNYSNTRGEEDALPQRYSLKVFAPEVKDQGRIPSCVSWASGYAGLTIVKRIEKGSLDVEPFSAMNLYNRARAYDNLKSCKSGSVFESNIKLLFNYGCATHMDFYETCEYLPPSKEYDHVLYDYEDLEVNSSNIRYSIAKNRPVMVGMKTYSKSYWGTMHYDPTGIWDGNHEGRWTWNHGMLIIGYDDTLSGGAFLVMNSWGKQFGKDGFFWLKYENVQDEVLSAYAMIPEIDNSKKVLNGKTRGEEQIVETIVNMDSRESFTNLKTSDNNLSNTDTILTIHNNCGFNFGMALGIKGNNGTYSKGWYNIDRFSTEQLPVFSGDTLFLFVNDFKRQISTSPAYSDEIAPFNVDFNHSFHMDFNDTLDKWPFIQLQLSDKSFNASLICIIDSIPKITLDHNGKLKAQGVVEQNLNWNGKIILFDPLTFEPILPNNKGKYDLYITDGLTKPKHIQWKLNKLVENNHLKFLNKENASQFINASQKH
jgi:hypothetical protein